jgi:hypothetical protein
MREMLKPRAGTEKARAVFSYGNITVAAGRMLREVLRMKIQVF